MIDTRVFEEVDELGQQVGSYEERRLANIANPILVDEPLVFVDLVASSDLLSPYEYVESICC